MHLFYKKTCKNAPIYKKLAKNLSLAQHLQDPQKTCNARKNLQSGHTGKTVGKGQHPVDQLVRQMV